MLREEIGAYVAVISGSRHFNVKRMELLVGPVTWYVPKGQAVMYDTMRATDVVEGGKLCASRNRALEDAFKLGVPCIQLSDDLKEIYYAVDHENEKEIEFEEAMKILGSTVRKHEAKLGGVAPTSNLFYFRGNRESINKFIVGDCIWVEPCEQRFDENMSLKEDYDYTLQHVKAHGKVVRCNDLLFGFAHRTNKGGAVEYRTALREYENIEYLRKKWGSLIGPSRRGPTEITLKI